VPGFVRLPSSDGLDSPRDSVRGSHRARPRVGYPPRLTKEILKAALDLKSVIEAGACTHCEERGRTPKKRYCLDCTAEIKKEIREEIPHGPGSQRPRGAPGSANPKLGGDPSPWGENNVRILEGD
jgi:hypothetical protein